MHTVPMQPHATCHMTKFFKDHFGAKRTQTRITFFFFDFSMEPEGLRLSLINDVASRITSNKGTLSDQDLALLSGLFGHSVVAVALEAAADHKVCLVTATPSGRTLFRFQWAGTSALGILSPLPFCSCKAFAKALDDNPTPVCKHILTAKLASALNTLAPSETVSEDDYTKLLLEIASTPIEKLN